MEEGKREWRGKREGEGEVEGEHPLSVHLHKPARSSSRLLSYRTTSLASRLSILYQTQKFPL